MGTRALIHFKEEAETICTVYTQCNGHLDWLGVKLAEFLNSGELVNGYTRDGKEFNGMGCLIAQFIAENKDGVGNLYVYPPNISDCDEEYTYTVEVIEGVIFMSCDQLRDDVKLVPSKFIKEAEILEDYD